MSSIGTSPTVDGDIKDSKCFSRTIGKCPVIKIKIQDVTIPCLLDTGSMVSTITESFYRKFIEPLGTKLNSSSVINLKAANGLNIPYVGYI